MALKKKITKEAWEKLSKDLQVEYVEKDGAYMLDVDGEEDIGALKRALDREREEGRANSKKAKELQEKLDAITDSDARKAGDIEKLESSWKKKDNETRIQYEDRIAKQNAYISNLLIGSESMKIASKISTVPALMQKALRERMTVDFTGDEPKLVILGSDGKPSSLTLDKLSEEFVANSEFKSIIIGSKASGGAGTETPKGSANSTKTTDDVSLAKMPVKDLAAFLKAKKESSK